MAEPALAPARARKVAPASPGPPPDGPAPAALVRAIDTLPAFPAALLRVRRALANRNATTDDIAASVAMDAGLSVAVRRLANSARYGVSDRRFSLTQSIARIGRSELLAMVDTLCVRQIFRNAVSPQIDGSAADPPALDSAGIWRFSLQGALSARHWAAHLPGFRIDREEAFAAALFRDLGRIYTDAHVLQGDIRSDPDQRLAAERDWLGFTHAELGAALLRRWDFPELVAQAIAAHHEPPSGAAPVPQNAVPQDPAAHAGPSSALALVAYLGDRAAVVIDDPGVIDPSEGAASPAPPPDPFVASQDPLSTLLPDPRLAWDTVIAATREDLSAYTALLQAA